MGFTPAKKNTTYQLEQMADTTTNLWLYRYLSQIKFLKGYRSKIMAVAFLGTHIPLLTLLFCFIASSSFSFGFAIRVLAIALVATLIGTAFTLYALHNLLAPVVLTARSLRNYINRKTLPDLPTEFTDEVGMLMSNTSQSIQKLDDVIHYMASYDSLTGLPNQTLFEYIKTQGCDEIQGYYFSRPIPADNLAQLLQNGANLSKTPEMLAIAA